MGGDEALAGESAFHANADPIVECTARNYCYLGLWAEHRRPCCPLVWGHLDALGLIPSAQGRGTAKSRSLDGAILTRA